MNDIYNMKESVYTKEKENEYNGTSNTRRPIVVVLIVSVVLIVLLNLITTIVFY